MKKEVVKVEDGLKKYHSMKALIYNDNKILLLKLNPKYKFLGDLWELPGGRKKVGETDKEALKREVKEETGLDFEVKGLVDEWKQPIPEKNSILYGKTFLCKSKTTKVKLKDPEKQHSNYRWVKIYEAKKFKIPAWLKNSISKLNQLNGRT